MAKHHRIMNHREEYGHSDDFLNHFIFTLVSITRKQAVRRFGKAVGKLESPSIAGVGWGCKNETAILENNFHFKRMHGVIS